MGDARSVADCDSVRTTKQDKMNCGHVESYASIAEILDTKYCCQDIFGLLVQD